MYSLPSDSEDKARFLYQSFLHLYWWFLFTSYAVDSATVLHESSTDWLRTNRAAREIWAEKIEYVHVTCVLANRRHSYSRNAKPSCTFVEACSHLMQLYSIATQMQFLPSASEPTEHPRTFELRNVQPTCVLVTKRNSYSRITNPSCTFVRAELVVTHAIGSATILHALSTEYFKTNRTLQDFWVITLPTCLWETEQKAIWELPILLGLLWELNGDDTSYAIDSAPILHVLSTKWLGTNRTLQDFWAEKIDNLHPTCVLPNNWEITNLSYTFVEAYPHLMQQYSAITPHALSTKWHKTHKTLQVFLSDHPTYLSFGNRQKTAIQEWPILLALVCKDVHILYRKFRSNSTRSPYQVTQNQQNTPALWAHKNWLCSPYFLKKPLCEKLPVLLALVRKRELKLEVTNRPPRQQLWRHLSSRTTQELLPPDAPAAGRTSHSPALGNQNPVRSSQHHHHHSTGLEAWWAKRPQEKWAQQPCPLLLRRLRMKRGRECNALQSNPTASRWRGTIEWENAREGRESAWVD